MVRSLRHERRFVEVIAIPGCSSLEHDANGSMGECNDLADSPRFFLRAVLIIPDECEVTNIAFYADDGNTSLSPSIDIDSESQFIL